VQGIRAKHVSDYRSVIHVTGESIELMQPGPARVMRARVEPLSAEELANTAEQYNMRVHVAAAEFPTEPPIKGMLFRIRGRRRGVMAVREQVSNGLLLGWVLEMKG
jgi:hypothetical protein